MIRWKCRYCGESMVADDEDLGEDIYCGECRRRQRVPGPGNRPVWLVLGLVGLFVALAIGTVLIVAARNRASIDDRQSGPAANATCPACGHRWYEPQRNARAEQAVEVTCPECGSSCPLAFLRRR